MAMRAVAIDPTQTFNRAISAYQAGRLGDAEQLCQQILSAQPGHSDAAHVLAVVQAARGRNDLALASYDRALALRPEQADVLNNRGNTLLALGRGEEAIASYDRALAARPNFPQGLLQPRQRVRETSAVGRGARELRSCAHAAAGLCRGAVQSRQCKEGARTSQRCTGGLRPSPGAAAAICRRPQQSRAGAQGTSAA